RHGDGWFGRQAADGPAPRRGRPTAVRLRRAPLTSRQSHNPSWIVGHQAISAECNQTTCVGGVVDGPIVDAQAGGVAALDDPGLAERERKLGADATWAQGAAL